MSNFNIQQALTDMEERIRQDIHTAREDTVAAATVAQEAKLEAVKISGRVKSLEEKAGWIAAGFGATLLSLLGFVWHVITSAVSKH